MRMSSRRKNKDPGPGQRKITSYFEPAAKEHTETLDLVLDRDADGKVTKFEYPSSLQPGSSSSSANPIKSDLQCSVTGSSSSTPEAVPRSFRHCANSAGDFVPSNTDQKSKNLDTSRVEETKQTKSTYVALDINFSTKSADVSKKRKIMEEQLEIKEKTEKKIAGSKFGSGESSFMCSAKTVPIFPSVNVTPMEDCSGSTLVKEISPSPQGSSLQPAVDSSHQIKSSSSNDLMTRNSFGHDKDYEDVKLTENKDSLVETEGNDGDEIAEKRKRFRSFTMEIETREFVEKVADLPILDFSFDPSEFEKVVTDAKKRVEIFQKAFEGFCKSIKSLSEKNKTYTCCKIVFKTHEAFKDHVQKEHVPSGSLCLSSLRRQSPLKPCGNSMEPDIEAGIRSKACGDFIYHFEMRSSNIKNRCRGFLYNFILMKGLPQSISEESALAYAEKNKLVVETYAGKLREIRKKLGNTICSEYHFFRSNVDGRGGSVVTQHLLQGYRCFYVAEEINRSFETKEGVERAEMLSQLFNKLCSKFTEFNDAKLKFSSRQAFEHNVASKYLTKQTFLKMVQDVVMCRGQVVVTGSDSTCVPFNGNYGQIKPVKLVEKFLDSASNFKLGDDVEKKKPHVPIRLIMSHEKFHARHIGLGLDLDYNLENQNEMETLWNILQKRHSDTFKADPGYSIALATVVPLEFEYKKENVYYFLSDEMKSGRKIRYTFLLDTERYFASRFCDSNEKYLVLRRWNFPRLNDKNRFFFIACIYAHFQTALSNNVFEYVDIESAHKLRLMEAKHTLSELDLRYAFALGNSGKPVICLQENCIENHYIYSDQTFAVPIHIDERVIVDIPLKNNRFTAN